MTDEAESNQLALEMLVALRGGLPECCDFCNQAYSDIRWPVPEEAGAWACNECYAKWEQQDAQEKDTAQ